MQKMLMPLPRCKISGHGEMQLRPVEKQTDEQKYCGVWYDCVYPGCRCSTLIPSQNIKTVTVIEAAQ